MSTKGRVKFTIWGMHDHLYFLRDYLIMQGFALVDYDEEPDFVLVGGAREWYIDEYALRNTRVLLLSGDCMYSDRNLDSSVRDKKPMREDDAILISDSLDSEVEETLNYLQAELHYVPKKAMVLRIFGTYGPNIKHGIVHSYIEHTQKSEPLPLIPPGYHTRTFLHETDFLEVFGKMLNRFLEGTTGVFNVGSDEETSLKRLADSVWQLRHGPQSEVQTKKVRGSRMYRWWVLPDLTRTKAMTKWKPRVTLRTGLWEMLNNG